MIRGKKLLILAIAFSAITVFKGNSVSASTAYTKVPNASAQQIVDDMKIGWNLGNTLDAHGYSGSTPLLSETYWGNPKATHALIDKVKAAGFNTIRIPTTWYNHMGSAPNYTIDPAWFARVEEVINYAFDNNMYVILNMHHEDSWLIPTFEKEKQVKDQLTKAWTQIATRFNKYGDYLILETMNEPRPVGAANEWSGGSAENRKVINNYNLAAVNTIRSTGGNNKTRCIMVPTLAASASSVTVNDLIIPNNDKKVIVSLHMYSPYTFAMDEKGTANWGTDADKNALASEFDAVANKFVKNGQAVVIGEFGSINKNNSSSRTAHAEYYAKAARARHITPIWWDNGYSTAGKGDTYGIINRNTLALDCPDVVSALMKGVSESGNTGGSGNNGGSSNTGGSSNLVNYGFEGSTAGWTATNASNPGLAWEWKHSGNTSLRADINLSSGAQYYLASTEKQDLSGKSQLKAIVNHAAWGNHGTGMGAKLYVKTGNSFKWFDGGYTKINSSSQGTELTLDLSKVSNLNDVREIGVQFVAGDNAAWGTAIYVDDVTAK